MLIDGLHDLDAIERAFLPPERRPLNRALTGSYLRTLADVEDRVASRLHALAQAKQDTSRFTRGMSFDSAEKYYRAGLRAFGVSEGETSGIGASSLRVLWQKIASNGAPRAMAFDSRECSSTLNSILEGVPQPRDASMKGEGWQR